MIQLRCHQIPPPSFHRRFVTLPSAHFEMSQGSRVPSGQRHFSPRTAKAFTGEKAKQAESALHMPFLFSRDCRRARRSACSSPPRPREVSSPAFREEGSLLPAQERKQAEREWQEVVNMYGC